MVYRYSLFKLNLSTFIKQWLIASLYQLKETVVIGHWLTVIGCFKRTNPQLLRLC